MDKKKILVVDDDRDLLRGMAIRLRANGYDTVCASDAIMAVSVAKNEKPDLIILDLGLPGGNGFVVMERLQDLVAVAMIPIIVLSAREPTEWKNRAVDAGAIAFFQKPADHKEIVSAIRKILSEDKVPD